MQLLLLYFSEWLLLFLLYERNSPEKKSSDFTSNLGGAVPGTILGIGFVLAFSTSPSLLVFILFFVMIIFSIGVSFQTRKEQLLAGIFSLAIALFLNFIEKMTEPLLLVYIVAFILLVFGFLELFNSNIKSGRRNIILALYLSSYGLIEYVTYPLSQVFRAVPAGIFKNAVTQLPDYIKLFFQLPHPILGCIVIIISVLSFVEKRTKIRQNNTYCNDWLFIQLLYLQVSLLLL